MRKVRIIVTGGTLDKVHDPRTEGLGFAPDGTSHVPAMLVAARCDHPAVERLMLNDSLDFDDADRDRIAEAVARAPEDALVVTHGTGTMAETARHLMARVPGKTVVLTGAMRPWSLGRSDAAFNLGGAILAAQLLGEGVWGVMNGRAIPASDLRKNVEAGRFDI